MLPDASQFVITFSIRPGGRVLESDVTRRMRGGAVGLALLSAVEPALLVQVGGNRCAERSEIRQGSHESEPRHGPFSPSDKRAGGRSSVGPPAGGSLLFGSADPFHCGGAGPQFAAGMTYAADRPP